MLETALFIAGVLLLFTIVVFIHELGHFLVARWCGVKVDAFWIGFGPEIFGFHDRAGTRWRFAWLPLGGYVKFIDDADAASGTGTATPIGIAETDTFRGKTVWQRAAIVAAGPLANFILAAVLLTGVYAVLGEQQSVARVDAIVEGGAADDAGFEIGDIIIGIDGSEIERFPELQQQVGMSAGKTLTFTVRRGDEIIDIVATPRAQETEALGRKIERGMLGIQYRATANEQSFRSLNLFEAAALGVGQTWNYIASTFAYLFDLVTFKADPNQVGGVITITKVAGEAAINGLLHYVTIIVLISISLGVINLMPIPLLDGGHLMMFAIEAVRGKPLGDNTQEMSFRIGLAVILTIMILVNGNDAIQELRSWGVTG